MTACLIYKLGEVRTESMLSNLNASFPRKAAEILGISVSWYQGFLAGFDGKPQAKRGSEYSSGFWNGKATRVLGTNVMVKMLYAIAGYFYIRRYYPHQTNLALARLHSFFGKGNKQCYPDK